MIVHTKKPVTDFLSWKMEEDTLKCFSVVVFCPNNGSNLVLCGWGGEG